MGPRWRAAWPYVALAAFSAFIYRRALAGDLYFGRDAAGYFIPDSAFLLQCLRRGELPLWIPHVLLGQPFAASPAAQVFYPPRLLSVLAFGPAGGFVAGQLLHALLAAAGALLCARKLGASRPSAFLGAVAFGLGPMLTQLATQQNVVDAAAWAGFVLAAVVEVVRRPSPRRLAALACVTSLAALAGSPETFLWESALAIALAAPAGRRALGRVAAGLAWGIAGAAAMVAPAAELALRSTRGGAADVLDWSTSWPQVLALAWPFADQPRGAYWWGGDQWFVLTVFSGTIACALALASGRSRRAVPLAIGGAFALALALGRHLPPAALLFRLPPLSFFRYPAKYLVGAAFAIAMLAALGSDRLAARARRMAGSPRRVAACAGAAMVAIGAGVPLARLSPLRSGAAGGLVWLAAALGLAGAAFLGVPGGPVRGRRVRAALVCLGVLELALFAWMHPPSGWTSSRRFVQPSSLAAAIPRPFGGRISVGPLEAEDPMAAASEHPQIHEVSRDALLGKRFIEEDLHALEGSWAPELRGVAEFQLSGARAVFDLAGVGYYVRRGPPPFPDLEKVAEVPGVRTLYRSATAMPRAFLVRRAEGVSDAAALERIRSPEEPAREVAFLAGGAPFSSSCEPGVARIEREGANAVELSVEGACAGLLVLSDTWYPGWRATVDGQSAELVRADFMLRAVRVPAGRHRVQMRFAPASVFGGAAVAAAAWLAMGLALARRRPRAPS